MKIKAYLILELTWLMVAIVCLALGMYKAFADSNAFNYTFFILAGVSFLMFFLRRTMRKNSMYNKN